MPDHSAGPIKKIFALYCDIIDEAGGIATIATILASNHISIKNIGIIHNREFEEGVVYRILRRGRLCKSRRTSAEIPVYCI